MLINAQYDKSAGWTVSENEAILIPEFKALLSEKDGVRLMAFVAIYADPSSFLAEVYEGKEERFNEAARAIFEKEIPKVVLKSKKVTDAISRYDKISNTKEVKIRKQVEEGMVNVGNFIEAEGQKLDNENIKDFMTTLKEMPTMLDKLTEIKRGTKEQVEETAKKVRGGRELTYREKKQVRKRK